MYRLGRGVAQSDTEAVKWYRKAAEQGDADGQVNLGWMYREGLGVAQSGAEAVKWYRKAAEQGDADAQNRLKQMGVDWTQPQIAKAEPKTPEPSNQTDADYQKGLDAYNHGDYQAALRELRPLAEMGMATAQVRLGDVFKEWAEIARKNNDAVKWFRNATEALGWYRKAAEQGNADGQVRLGAMYEEGYGIDQDYTEAVLWYRESAEQGNSLGQNNLGEMYKRGRGVLQSFTEAMIWFRKSAEQGEAVGQYNLGSMYGSKRAYDWVEREENHAEELKWYRKAAMQGYERAQEALEYLGVDWTKPQIAKAEPGTTEPTNQANADDSERVKELEKRLAQIESERLKDKQALAALEAQTKQTEQAIASDNTPPIIRITSSTTEGLQARISAEVTDNVSVGEVTLNGSPPLQINGSTYYWETFIPSDGLTVLIEAVDQCGLMSRKSTRIEREKTTETVTRLAAVNPLLGPKQKPSRDRAALIIGLDKYASVPSADFASRDAQMFADYAREKLGIADNNIKILTDTEASETAILRALKVWLPKAVKPDTTDLYVFYAGHGMPTADGTSAYLVPYDGDIQLLEDTAISRKRFFDEISATKPRSATFFFDNCFSGATRSEQQLLAARPLTIKVEETDVPDNYLVFAAGETDQIAGVEPEVKHGRFSYFVFKGLEGEADANQDGKISAGELHTYVRESVGRFSAGAQTPTMLGDAGIWVVR